MDEVIPLEVCWHLDDVRSVLHFSFVSHIYNQSNTYTSPSRVLILMISTSDLLNITEHHVSTQVFLTARWSPWPAEAEPLPGKPETPLTPSMDPVEAEPVRRVRGVRRCTVKGPETPRGT